MQNRCEWLDAPPAHSWHGALIANEGVDALPVRQFVLRDDGLFAGAVGTDASGRFGWREAPAVFAMASCESQAQFLIRQGLEKVFSNAYSNAPDETARYALAQQVKRLTLPGQMGEAFRIMAFRRG